MANINLQLVWTKRTEKKQRHREQALSCSRATHSLSMQFTVQPAAAAAATMCLNRIKTKQNPTKVHRVASLKSNVWHLFSPSVSPLACKFGSMCTLHLIWCRFIPCIGMLDKYGQWIQLVVSAHCISLFFSSNICIQLSIAVAAIPHCKSKSCKQFMWKTDREWEKKNNLLLPLIYWSVVFFFIHWFVQFLGIFLLQIWIN